MKPNKTWEYTTKRAGRYHDWVNGGTPGSFTNFQDGTYYYMPLFHYHQRSKNGVYLSGGEWCAFKRKTTYGGDDTPIFRRGYGQAFSGKTRVIAAPLQPFADAELVQMLADLSAKGAEAWAKLKPAQPNFSAATSLAELRELPGALKLRLRDIKNIIRERRKRKGLTNKVAPQSFKDQSYGNIVGNSYLAFAFGWLPLVKDIRKFTEAFSQRKKAFDQMLRDEGKPVKRSCQVSSPPDTSTTQTFNRSVAGTCKNSDVSPTFVTQCYASNTYKYLSVTKVHTEITYKTWAVGKFRYYLPKGPRDGPWKRRLVRRIMGLRITPEVLYNIMPWSWLADYFTGLGHFMSAISGGVEDLLVADYAYVMRTVTRKTTYECHEPIIYNKSGNGQVKISTLVVEDVVKMRLKATPFGFGFNEENLSLRQKAVLGALGLSRL